MTFSLSIGQLQPNQNAITRVKYITKLEIRDGSLVAFLPPVPQTIPFSFNVEGSISQHIEGMTNTIPTEINITENGEGIYIMTDNDFDETTVLGSFVNKEEVGTVDVVFLCDRSGSMSGPGITALVKTLQLFLRQLPPQTKFNIVSFETNHEGIYKTCVPYTDESLEFASKVVEHFQANFSGKKHH